MTKAKTKSRRVWLSLNERGAYRGAFFLFDARRAAMAFKPQESVVIPATLTWTPPAKAKKRSAKR